MTAFDEIRDNLRQTFVDRLSPETIGEIENVVCVVLGNYDITAKETRLVVFDNGDTEIVRRFFLAKAIQGCTPKTAETYSNIIKYFLSGVCKHIVDITTDDIRLYLARKKIERASDSYMATIHRTLSSFFSWCATEEIIHKNPMLRVEKVRIRKRRKIRSRKSSSNLYDTRQGQKERRHLWSSYTQLAVAYQKQ